MFCCSFFRPPDQPCKTLQAGQVALKMTWNYKQFLRLKSAILFLCIVTGVCYAYMIQPLFVHDGISKLIACGVMCLFVRLFVCLFVCLFICFGGTEPKSHSEVLLSRF